LKQSDKASLNNDFTRESPLGLVRPTLGDCLTKSADRVGVIDDSGITKNKNSLHRYFIIHKPYKMLSQFVGGDEGARLLGELDYNFPEGIHAIGRLDNDSEGLLILTTDKRITKLLFNSGQPHERTYLVKVQRKVTEETLEKLRSGVEIRIRGGDYWTTSPCEVELADEPQNLPDIPERLMYEGVTSWLIITLKEGKYHQVRKMVLAVGHKCKRLIRTSIDNLELEDLQSGGVLEIAEEKFFEKLHLIR
jgi:23S rRNA pseudouridine2457 synthase